LVENGKSSRAGATNTRRTHLRRGHANILKRLLIHVAGFNLSLVMRKVVELGAARGLWGLAARIVNVTLRFLRTTWSIVTNTGAQDALPMSHCSQIPIAT